MLAGNQKKEAHQSDIREVGYYLKEDEETQGLYYLIRREQNHYDENPEEGGKESILLENVMDLRFEFKRSRSWTAKWDASRNKRMPTGVRTTIKLKNYRGSEVSFIFISFVNQEK